MWMDRIVFGDVEELVGKMLCDIDKTSYGFVSVFCHYDLAVELIRELIFNDIAVGRVNINDYSWNLYDDEYEIAVRDNLIYCNPAFSKERGYLYACPQVAYVHQDCNSKILKHIDCENMYEFAISDIDEEYDEDTDCDGDCDLCCDTDSLTIVRDKTGKIVGINKSWSDGHASYYYSYYSDNEDDLIDLARNLDIIK